MLFLLAQDAPAAGISQTVVMLALALVFFYFILWRPEQKRRKAADAMRAALKRGDRVTAMGIVGRIDDIRESTIIIKTADGTKIEMLKMAITDVQSQSES